MEDGASDIVIFFGRFHPLILHVPIGFLVLAFILEICSRFKRFSHYKPAIGMVLLLGAISATVAAILGYMLALPGGYNDDLLAIHQWSGIGVAFLGIAAFILRAQKKRRDSIALDRAYLVVLSAMIFSLALAGHFGGSLTHGADYLTKYMPDGLRKIAGIPLKEKKEIEKITNLPEAVVFNDIIYPILDTYCTSCHNDSKRKGDLMMHTPEVLLKGGENGPLFVAGDASNSHMIQKIQLPEGHEDHMPPIGKPQLSDDQIELLIWWVNEGAPFQKKVAEVAVSNEVQSILETLVDPNANKSQAEILLSSAVQPASQQMLQSLRVPGVMVATLSDSIYWLQAEVAFNQPGDSLVKSFATVSEQLTWLNLRGTVTTDEGLEVIGGFKYLTRLDLGKTAISDEGLAHLKDLAYLESLNLYETEVSDKGMEHLANLKNLRKLYVWKTNVTEEGASRLKEALPGLQVILGLGTVSNEPMSSN